MNRPSERALDAFKRHDGLDQLQVFGRFGASETGASLNLPAIEARAASLDTLRTCAVAGSPGTASSPIQGAGRPMPADAQTL